MTTTTYEFVDGNSGRVEKGAISFTAYTGSANCITKNIPATGIEGRAMFQFDTSTIPSTATVDLVEFELTEAAAQSMDHPDGIMFHIGQFIGATLNGNNGEFTGGTETLALSWPWTADIFYDLSTDRDATEFVGKGAGATTDVSIWGSYAGGVTQSRIWNATKNKCSLRVTYTASFIPRLALMGVGGSLLVSIVVKSLNFLAASLFPEKFYTKTVVFSHR